MSMDKIRIEIPIGMELRKAASFATEAATEKGVAVEFDFNGVGCLIRPYADSDDLADYIFRQMNQRQKLSATGIEKQVCDDIAARQQKGIAKYGKTVEESPDDMIQHAYEEALDLAVYLKAEITKRANAATMPILQPCADRHARFAPPECSDSQNAPTMP